VAADAGTAAGLGSPSGPQGDSWNSIGQLPNFAGAWYRPNMFTAPPPGAKPPPRISPPYTPAYQKLAASHASDATVDNNALHCLPDGTPAIMSAPFSFEFLLTPGRVTIIAENGEVRRIFTDGRGHPADLDATFEGHSIGHWENGVLVVDTIGISKDAELAHGVHQTGQTHVLERIYLKNPNALEDDVTMTDAIALKAPYESSLSYVRTPVGMVEYVCEQNNKKNDEFPESSTGK
jgi:hypothetical protein